MVKTLPATGRAQLFDRCGRLPAERKVRGARASPLYRSRQLVLRLGEQGEKYCWDQTAGNILKTNNRTEQTIGRWRTRSRSVRGFKSWPGVSAAFMVCGQPVF